MEERSQCGRYINCNIQEARVLYAPWEKPLTLKDRSRGLCMYNTQDEKINNNVVGVPEGTQNTSNAHTEMYM